jgi:nitrite reductase/ring-hydroxylating ferredoxin subunit
MSGPDHAFEDVAADAEIEEGGMLGVTLSNGEPVCVLRHAGTISAVGNLCTHALFHLSDGVLHADGTLECVWHGARFDCRTGAAKRHPAEWPIPVYGVRVESGRVLVGPPVDVQEQKQA